ETRRSRGRRVLVYRGGAETRSYIGLPIAVTSRSFSSGSGLRVAAAEQVTHPAGSGCARWGGLERTGISATENSGMQLNYWRKGLDEVPPEVFSHPELEVLILADNRLTRVPEEIGTLRRLRMLDLGHNQIADLPETMAQIGDISDYLYLHDNRLNEIRESLFAGMKKLRYLNLSENRLTRLPDSIGNLISLEELHADGNPLGALPESFSRLTALREVHLRNAGLQEVPECLRALTRLNILDLHGNHISEIPEWLSGLSELVKLDLRWNPISGTR